MKNGSIFLIQDNNQLLRLEETSYESEELLQKLLDNYPELLAGNQINCESPRRWIPIAREFGIPGTEMGSPQWRIDHLFIDQDCIPTFIEVKRSTDTRIRREVVGQMMDYAANATKYWPIDVIQKAFSEKYLKDGGDTIQVLYDFLGIEVGDSEGIDEFWAKVYKNLQEGYIRMLFVADEIPDELRRIIEFMNDQMAKSEVLGLEVKQYLNPEKNIRTLVPQVIGMTTSTRDKKPLSKKQWTEESFMNEIESRLGSEARQAYQEIFNNLSNGPYNLWYGKGLTMGSIFFVYEGVVRHSLIAMWTYGQFELQFQYLKNQPPFSDLKKRMEFKAKLKELLDVEITEESLNYRPSFSWEKLMSDTSRENLSKLLSWAVEEINNYETRLGEQ